MDVLYGNCLELMNTLHVIKIMHFSLAQGRNRCNEVRVTSQVINDYIVINYPYLLEIINIVDNLQAETI